MSESSKRIVLTRREALLLSATAGISMVGGNPALASSSIKTASHQEPGNCSTPGSAVTAWSKNAPCAALPRLIAVRCLTVRLLPTERSNTINCSHTPSCARSDALIICRRRLAREFNFMRAFQARSGPGVHEETKT